MEIARAMSFSWGRCWVYSELYPDLDPRALYTSEQDLKNIVSHPLVSGTWVDFGAGDGESLYQYALLHPHQRAIGIELCPQRVAASEKKLAGVAGAEIVLGDLWSCEVPLGQTYFFYFPTGPVLDRLLSVLSQRQKNFVIVAIESHGDLLSRLDREAWLSRSDEIPLSSARHYPNAVFYKACPTPVDQESLTPWNVSFREYFLEVHQNDSRWIGDTLGMTHHSEMTFNLLHPPRTLLWSEVEAIHSFEDLGPLLQVLTTLRRRGVVDLETEQTFTSGLIRKIILWPVFSLELSSGEKIEWRHIKIIKQGSFTCYDSSSSSFSFPPVAAPLKRVEKKLTPTS
jgi:hypothetical protein